jgi:hypothetical protein
MVFSGANWISNRRTLWTVMPVGLLLLALSFPAYLILESARSLWRTQILSGFGAALILAAAIGLCASYVPRKWLRFSVVALMGALVVGYGSFSALKKAAFHQWVWERQRSAMAQVLSVAPRLKPGTLVFLTNVPKDDDPFLGDDMWFDMALRLAYPGTQVAGVYSYEGGTPAVGDNLKRLKQSGVAANMLVLQYQPQGVLSIARSVPGVLGVDETGLYNPQARIESGSPSPRAIRRYE